MKQILIQLILTYLRTLARLQLKKNPQAVVVGITGSAGKTSTRRALTLILAGKGRVKQSKKANSESGIPLNILGLSPHSYSALDWLRLLALAPVRLLTHWERFDYYVVEMGIDSPHPPKNMEYLLKIVKPDVGVVLNVGLVHSQAFDHLVKDRHPERRAVKVRAEIAKEKLKLAKGIDPSGVVIINSDQPELNRAAAKLKSRVIRFGLRQGANLRLQKPIIKKNGFSFTFTYQGKTYHLALPDLYEEGYLYTFGAAIAAAAGLGIPPSVSLKRLADYRSPPGRLRLFAGQNHTTILDSSYNASPDTMLAALKLLDRLTGPHPRLAIIGDMRELGQNTKLAHKKLADWLAKYSDQAILFGPATKAHTLPVLASRRFPAKHFSKMSSLTAYLTTHLQQESYVLVKGSQNTIFLERAVESLLADPQQVNELCRRGKYWTKIRAKTP